jgi:uncharacterized repeat protein (TIGR03803 family)
MIRLNLGRCAIAVPTISAVFLTACGGGSTALPAQPATSMFADPLGHELQRFHSFRARPNGLVAYNGVFYGTTVAAGWKNYGDVFSLDTSGKKHVLHVFRGGTDPAYPTAGLIVVNGVLYGTTVGGGTGWLHNKQCQTGPPPSGGEGCGTVFSITTSGEVRVLHSFKGGSDGNIPVAGLTLLNGKLYGVTFVGGTRHSCGQYIGTGCGTVFEVSISGEERIVYRFRGGKDGAAPEGTLLALDGKLVGTTYSGGEKTCYRSRCGTLFEVTPSGSEDVLYRFKGGKDGANPQAGLISAGGALFGTTTEGGAACSDYGCGTIFEATAAGAERVLYAFKGIPDGAYPTSQLTEVNGALYGVTPNGGAQCDAPSGPDTGTIFELTTTGTEKIVHRFACETYSTVGAEPASPLVHLAQKLYGTTSSGGHYNGGTAFALSL